jgi:hypothetical protein
VVDHLAAGRIDGDDHALARELAEEVRLGLRADDDLGSARGEHLLGPLDGADPAAHAALGLGAEAADQLEVVALAQRRIEVDDGDGTVAPEAAREAKHVAALEHLLPAATQLHRLAAHQIDARNDHCRTSTPRPRR